MLVALCVSAALPDFHPARCTRREPCQSASCSNSAVVRRLALSFKPISTVRFISCSITRADQTPGNTLLEILSSNTGIANCRTHDSDEGDLVRMQETEIASPANRANADDACLDGDSLAESKREPRLWPRPQQELGSIGSSRS